MIRQAPPAIVRFDWHDRRIYDDVVASVPAGAELTVATNVDLVWVDDSAGDLVWSINPWGINAIRKNDASTPLLGESGEVIEDGSSSGASGPGAVRPGVDPATNERQPDDNGIDDPPVAFDDPVTSRSGKAVPVVVTANDYDPDGEAIAVVAVGTPAHGTVDIANASTVVYQPEPGYVGLDRFDYTIVDGNGTEASAVVILELLPVDAPNQAPVARDDVAETGPDVGVVIDVLLNDVDPERDALRVGVVHAARHRRRHHRDHRSVRAPGVAIPTTARGIRPGDVHLPPGRLVRGDRRSRNRPRRDRPAAGREPSPDRAARRRPAPAQHTDPGARARQRPRSRRRSAAALGDDPVAGRDRGRGRWRHAACHRPGRRARARAVHVPGRRPARQRRRRHGAWSSPSPTPSRTAHRSSPPTPRPPSWAGSRRSTCSRTTATPTAIRCWSSP